MTSKTVAMHWPRYTSAHWASMSKLGKSVCLAHTLVRPLSEMPEKLNGYNQVRRVFLTSNKWKKHPVFCVGLWWAKGLKWEVFFEKSLPSSRGFYCGFSPGLLQRPFHLRPRCALEHFVSGICSISGGLVHWLEHPFWKDEVSLLFYKETTVSVLLFPLISFCCTLTSLNLSTIGPFDVPSATSLSSRNLLLVANSYRWCLRHVQGSFWEHSNSRMPRFGCCFGWSLLHWCHARAGVGPARHRRFFFLVKNE